MRLKKLLVLTLTSALLLSGCGSTSQKTEEKIVKEQAPVKEVQVFDLGKDDPMVTFTKSGVASSQEQVYIFPETAGKIVTLNYQVGDTVKKGSTVAVLGDSVATKVANIQSQSATESLKIAREMQNLTDSSAQTTQEIAYMGTVAALKSLNNAKTVKSDSKKIYNIQIDGAEIGKEMAEDAEDLAKQMGGSADGAVDQAENGIDLLRQSYKSQTHQLDFSIEMAFIQYQNAIRQWEASIVGAGQQQKAAEIQVVQADSGAKMAQVSSDAKYVKSPISGVITAISVEENDYTGPGTPIITVENSASLSLKISLNPYEATLVKKGDKVTIKSDFGEAKGEINWVSPSANAITKKIDIEILVASPDGIIPGTMVRITFAPTEIDRIFIPLNSIHNLDNDHFVNIVKDGKVTAQNIKMGEITGDYVEILSGLKGNEKIVTSTEIFLEEGEKVKIANK